MDEQKARLRRSASAINQIGCDPKCHPERTRWFKVQPEFHTPHCTYRSALVDCIFEFVDSIDDPKSGAYAIRMINLALEVYQGHLEDL